MKEIKKNFWKNKKILITGHTGFTGIWLTTLLSNYGAKITGISLDDNTQPAIYKTLKINKKVKNIYIDVANFSSLKEVILKCNAEIIIHLAAQSLVQKSYKYSHKTFLTNTIGTLNLLEILKDNKYVKAIFIATTDKVYLNNEKKKVFMECDALGGDDPYSSSKSSAEIIINSYYKSFFKKKK